MIGSGAAGLNAAVQLHAQGIEDVLIVTEGLAMGTSINTGSDKQTYYKLGMCGAEADSPEDLAETLFAGGSMHGDLALVEASLSARCFLHLVQPGRAVSPGQVRPVRRATRPIMTPAVGRPRSAPTPPARCAGR